MTTTTTLAPTTTVPSQALPAAAVAHAHLLGLSRVRHARFGRRAGPMATSGPHFNVLQSPARARFSKSNTSDALTFNTRENEERT